MVLTYFFGFVLLHWIFRADNSINEEGAPFGKINILED